MVKVAVAGGTGNVAREVIDRILAKDKHEVIVLTQRVCLRSNIAIHGGAKIKKAVSDPNKDISGVKFVRVDYTDTHGLAQALAGTDVVLCFLAALDKESAINNSKNLIDASIKAGARRFAPSEWACRDNTLVPHYHYKDAVRTYLEEINRDEQKLEYTLFQPGLFTNYFAYPHSSTRHFSVSPWFVDFENRRAIVVDDGIQSFTTTTVEDFSGVVAEALDFEGKWPITGGIMGSRITVKELVELAETLRGPIEVERLAIEDLEAGQFNTSWVPIIQHPSMPDEHREAISRQVMFSYVLSTAKGAWVTMNDWNIRLPDYQFTSAAEYVRRAWAGK